MHSFKQGTRITPADVSEFNRLTESLGGAARQSRLLREAEAY
ncbi:MAG: hypothetical protein ACKO9H_19190 [Planctomycetota bacterium]